MGCSQKGHRHDVGLSHFLWVCLLFFKSHLRVDRAKHKIFERSDLSRETHSTNAPTSTSPESSFSISTRGHQRTWLRSNSPTNKERAGKIPASFYFSKCPLVGFHRRSAMAPHRPPITAAVGLSVCALIGLPRGRSAPEAATGSRRIRVLKNAGSESAKRAF